MERKHDMTSRNLVDPALLPLLAFPRPELTREALPAIREQAAQMMEMAGLSALPEGVEAGLRTVPGPDGAPDVPVVILRPSGDAAVLPAILHIHGGGYVMGSAEGYRPAAAKIAAATGALVVSVDYRLAPETPFPGPVEDCYAALRWLHGHAAELGVDPARIAIAGESAGGGLAAALALLARDRGEVPVVFQSLTFPMIDDRTGSTVDRGPLAGEFLWTAESNRFGWTALLGYAPGGEDVSPYAAAARATDLAGLPPTFLAVGTLDLFFEENLEYVRRLTRAGVPVTAAIYPGAPHGFMLVEQATVSQRYARDFAEAMRAALWPAQD